jgi:hypothetical protein
MEATAGSLGGSHDTCSMTQPLHFNARASECVESQEIGAEKRPPRRDRLYMSWRCRRHFPNCILIKASRSYMASTHRSLMTRLRCAKHAEGDRWLTVSTGGTRAAQEQVTEWQPWACALASSFHMQRRPRAQQEVTAAVCCCLLLTCCRLRHSHAMTSMAAIAAGPADLANSKGCGGADSARRCESRNTERVGCAGRSAACALL